MIAIEQRGQRAFGHRRRMIAQLPQSLEPQLAHALDVGVGEIRRDRHLGEQRAAPAP